MLVGEYLEHNSTTVRSYPEARQSLQATSIIDVDVVVGSPTLVAVISHQNADDGGNWTTLGTFSSITGTGIHKLDISGVKERIRWDFSFTGGSAGNSVRFLRDIIWRPNAT